MKWPRYSFLSLFFLFLPGCSLLPEPDSQQQTTTFPVIKTAAQRLTLMRNLSHWHAAGKIAFIEKDQRKSVSFAWQKNGQQSQALNLSTYLGINVFKLTSVKNQHTIDVDGQTHHSDNLSLLIWQLTNMQLPVDALAHWIKALPYSAKDSLTYQTGPLFPSALTSHFNGQTWQIRYSGYQLFNGLMLPTRLSIKQQELTIKIQINQWTL
ncbi:MAG: lipoprotein insertase outer membrane protein LolB [Thalassotalea sp.]